MCGVGVAVLAEIFAHIMAEPEVLCMGRVHLHATPCAPVTLSCQLSIYIPVAGRGWRDKERDR